MRLKFSNYLVLLVMMAACSADHVPARPLVRQYLSRDIDPEKGTIKYESIASLLDEQISIEGIVKSSSHGDAILFLAENATEIDTDSYDTCINLIVDEKRRFKPSDLHRYRITGKFVLIGRTDSSIVYLTYNNIRFDTSCQQFKKTEKYPYFVVTSFTRLEN